MINLQDIETLLQEGYLIIGKDKLQQLGFQELKDYENNVLTYRNTLRTFFELPLHIKKQIESASYKYSREDCHPTGYWAKSVYTESVDFCMEYFTSRNYFENSLNEICVPDEKEISDIEDLLQNLPSKATYGIMGILDEHILTPVLQALSEKSNHPMPPATLQLQCAYYPKDSVLGMHQDSSFLTGIIGPLSGFKIQSQEDGEMMYVNLSTGEIILYFGFQSRDHCKEKLGTPPEPLRHMAEAYAGRMSTPFACGYDIPRIGTSV